jgi:cell division septal protein FtsQ
MAARNRKRPKKQYSRTRSRAPAKNRVRHGLVILFLILTALLLLAGLYQGVRYAGSLFFSRNPEFELKNIDIHSDGRLQPEQLREYIQLQGGENLFSVDFNRIRRKLQEVPLVESVAIERKLPDTLTIRVVERVAIAQLRWSRRGLPFLLDRHGVVLPMTRSGQSLPLIDGFSKETLRPGERVEHPGVLQCLNLLSAADQLGSGAQITFDGFDVRYPDFIIVAVNGGVSARFPLHSAREKLVRLISVLQLAGEQGRRVKTVDLTPDGRNVLVTFQ